MKTFTLIFFMLLVTSLSYGQSRHERLGNREFDVYNYPGAIERFEQIGDQSVDVQRKLAYSHRFLGNLNKARDYYALVAASEERTASDLWEYAQVLMALEQYEQAQQQLAVFYELAPGDSRTQRFRQAGDFVTDIRAKVTHIKVTNLDISNINQDFGVVFYGNQVVFASSRQTADKPRDTWPANNLPFLLPFMADTAAKGQLRNPRPFMPQLFRGDYHIGPVAFNPAQDMLAVTVNHEPKRRSGETLNLKLLTSRLGDEGWSKPEPLPFNNPEYSVGQASFSPDGRTMFFISDMPGGKGGTDIYSVSVDAQGVFGTPRNLSDINTEGDEMFPLLHKNGKLYFSSDGYPGLGGLDIFHADHDAGRFTNITNMGTPINSSGDDLAIFLHEDAESGYFSTRRPGGKGNDDIMHFYLDMPEPRLALTKTPNPGTFRLPGETIVYTLLVRNTGGAAIHDLVVEDPLTGLSVTVGTILPGASREFSETYVVRESDIEATKIVNVATAKGLAPNGDEISVRAEALVELRDFIDVGPIFFDFDEYNIRPDAAAELDRVVRVMNDYPNLVIEVGSHTDCRGTREYNEELSENRARSTVQYIRERITNPGRITGKGYGESRLINRCDCNEDPPCDEDAHQENRRSEFKIIRLR
jgi:uncharacterized repeat protein (TIGR01451 family)